MADRWMLTNIRGRIYTSAVGVFLCVPALLGLGYAWSLCAAVALLSAVLILFVKPRTERDISNS